VTCNYEPWVLNRVLSGLSPLTCIKNNTLRFEGRICLRPIGKDILKLLASLRADIIFDSEGLKPLTPKSSPLNITHRVPSHHTEKTLCLVIYFEVTICSLSVFKFPSSVRFYSQKLHTLEASLCQLHTWSIPEKYISFFLKYVWRILSINFQVMCKRNRTYHKEN
jgi:hypothetical protein